MSDQKKGTLYSLLSALIFGITPLFSSLSYQCGSNALTLTFYRNIIAIPIMLVILLARHVDLRISLRDFAGIAAIGALFNTTTTYALFDSYNYIGIGLATTLHFLYPITTVLIGRVLFKSRLDKSRIIALIMATVGVAIASGSSDSYALKGVILAVFSAITYTGYLLGLEKGSASKMDSLKAMFYICIANSVASLIFNIPSGDIVFNLTPMAFFYTGLVAVGNSIIGYVLMLMAIKKIGSGNVAIFSMLEPVSGVVAGVIFLSEGLPLTKLISCFLILVGVSVPMIHDRGKGQSGTESKGNPE